MYLSQKRQVEAQGEVRFCGKSEQAVSARTGERLWRRRVDEKYLTGRSLFFCAGEEENFKLR